MEITPNTIKGPQSLVSPNKASFILCARVKKLPYVFAPFEVINGNPSPSLVLDINRLRRAKDLLRSLPSVFTMYSNGKELQVDAVHKLISFTRPTFRGLIQYHLTNPNALDFQIDVIFEDLGNKYPPQYIVVSQEDDTKYVPSTLKVFPIMFHEGATMCVLDSVEKVLHTSVMDNETGLLGITETHEYKRLLTIQSIWPELNIEFHIKDNQVYVYSKLLAGKLPLPQAFIKLHRNFGGTDITMNVSHHIPSV